MNMIMVRRWVRWVAVRPPRGRRHRPPRVHTQEQQGAEQTRRRPMLSRVQNVGPCTPGYNRLIFNGECANATRRTRRTRNVCARALSNKRFLFYRCFRIAIDVFGLLGDTQREQKTRG